MCLEQISEKKVANKDIVCYKRLKIRTPQELDCKHGDTFTGNISGVRVSGKISLENGIHLCSDNPDANGHIISDKLGYNYSWRLDNESIVLTINGREIPKSYITPYQNANVNIGETYMSDLKVNGVRQINTGLHSYANLLDAKGDGQGVYVKCVIPEGSIYYKGTFWNSPAYASNKLTYVELVK